jgi:hypothetical protein
VSKSVFGEMFEGCVVDAQFKFWYLKVFGELKGLLFDLLWFFVLPT